MNLKDSVIKNLFVLMSVFIFGYSGIVIIHLYFTNIVSNLDKQIKNEQARYKLGEYILNEITEVESNFYKMTLLDKPNEIKPVKDSMREDIEDIKNVINILENGGTFNNTIKVNLVGLENINEKITFFPENNIKYSFEAIDLIPKFATIEKRIHEIDKITELKENFINSNDLDERKDIKAQINIFVKQLSPLFSRMKENASRLLYDSRLNSEKLHKKIDSKKEYYHILEALLTILVIAVVVILGTIISKQIQKKSEDLKFVTEEARNSAIEASNANKVKSQFLANMSHEIRTPLNAIIGFSEILSQAKLEAKDKEQANIILKSAKSLLNIINDILDISKVESGKFEIIDEKFAARKFFEQIVELFSVSAEKKNIRFLYNYNTQIPMFLIGDTTRLKQVLSNLLSNAIKFTNNGKHVIFTVKLLELSQEKAHIKFSVKDEGIGINKEQQKNIFLPFSQADSSISREFGGTGLGLAISHQIVKLMGSEIQLISKKDKGSDFFFDLNFPIPSDNKKSAKKLNYNFLVTTLCKDEEFIRFNLINYLDELGHIFKLEDSAQKIDSKIDLIFYFGEEELYEKIKECKNLHKAKVVFVGNRINIEDNNIIELVDYYIDVPLYGSKIFNIISTACNIDKKELTNEKIQKQFIAKILVAEDNENNQRLIQILLEKLGVICEIASNGQEAIDIYKEKDFDMVFMDINMPIMDGLTALSHIKKLEKYDNNKTPIVALTANTIKGDKEKYLNSGMDNYLSKPIVMNELLHILNLYLVDNPLDRILISKDDKKTDSKPTLKNENLKSEKKREIKTITGPYKKEHTINQLGLPDTIVDKLLTKFLSTLDNDIKKIEEAIESKDNKTIFDACHYLKGPSSNFAMKGAVELLLEFEKIAKENLESEYKIEKLKEYFEEVKKELK